MTGACSGTPTERAAADAVLVATLSNIPSLATSDFAVI